MSEPFSVGLSQNIIGKIANSTGMDLGAVRGIFDPVTAPEENLSVLAQRCDKILEFVSPTVDNIVSPGRAKSLEIDPFHPFPGALTDVSQISQQSLSGMSGALGKINAGLEKMGIIIVGSHPSELSSGEETGYGGGGDPNIPGPGTVLTDVLEKITKMTSLVSDLNELNLSLGADRIIGDIGVIGDTGIIGDTGKK